MIHEDQVRELDRLGIDHHGRGDVAGQDRTRLDERGLHDLLEIAGRQDQPVDLGQCLERGELPAELRGHAIESLGELAELVLAVERHGPIELLVGDPARARDDGVERHEGAANPPNRDEQHADQDREQKRREDRLEEANRRERFGLVDEGHDAPRRTLEARCNEELPEGCPILVPVALPSRPAAGRQARLASRWRSASASVAEQ